MRDSIQLGPLSHNTWKSLHLPGLMLDHNYRVHQWNKGRDPNGPYRHPTSSHTQAFNRQKENSQQAGDAPIFMDNGCHLHLTALYLLYTSVRSPISSLTSDPLRPTLSALAQESFVLSQLNTLRRGETTQRPARHGRLLAPPQKLGRPCDRGQDKDRGKREPPLGQTCVGPIFTSV